MHIEWHHTYTYRNELRRLAVVYDDGAVTVTEADGTVHRLTYADGALTGSGSLAQTHRVAIAAHIAANLAASAVGI
jgi:YD repeat-containing protein